MNFRIAISLLVLMAVSAFASACGASVTDETALPSENPIDSATAYPPSNQIFLPVTGSEAAYPAPEPQTPVDPYPGVTDGSSAFPWVSQPVAVDPQALVPFSNVVPSASDAKLALGTAFVESIDLVRPQDDPEVVTVVLTGNLPTPCNQLRVLVSEPAADGMITLEVYSVIDPEMMCIQVLAPFQTSIPLSDLPAGEYTISVNQEQTVQFQLP